MVLLDHGLYKTLPTKVKEHYKGMWRSIITQNEEEVKKHAEHLGIHSMYPLLAGMIVGRTWEDIMDKEQGLHRLKNSRADGELRQTMRLHAFKWQKEINVVLRKMDQDLILVFKTLEWLRSVDASLGSPISSIQVLAEYCTREEVNTLSRLWIRLKIWVTGWI